MIGACRPAGAGWIGAALQPTSGEDRTIAQLSECARRLLEEDDRVMAVSKKV